MSNSPDRRVPSTEQLRRIRCLLTDDRDEAMRIAGELDDLNQQRRSRQSQMQREALDQLKTPAQVASERGIPVEEVLPFWESRKRNG